MPSRNSLRAGLVVGLLAAAGSMACGPDPFSPRATLENLNSVVEVWALTGSPANFPTVHLVPQRITVRPDAAGSFDLGFDIDADGRLLVLPVNRVVTPLGGNRSIGIQKAAVPYAEVAAAPRDGYVFDSTAVFEVGDTFIVRVQTLFCSTELRDHVFAKYSVDSIFPAERRIRLSGRVNPNCGFRSFGDGVPTF